MADPISNASAASSFLRAIQVPIAGLKANQDTSQQLINQLQKTVSPAKGSAVTLTSSSVGPSSNLPRGSIVDKLV